MQIAKLKNLKKIYVRDISDKNNFVLVKNLAKVSLCMLSSKISERDVYCMYTWQRSACMEVS